MRVHLLEAVVLKGLILIGSFTPKLTNSISFSFVEMHLKYIWGYKISSPQESNNFSQVIMTQ